MEREELLQEVQSLIEADGKQLSRSISEETINAELDDELENIGDDEEANKKVYSRIAKRLIRMDGNIHSNVSREVKDYKAKHKPTTTTTKVEKTGGEEESEELKMLKKLEERLNGIEESRKKKEDAEAKNASIETVKKKLSKKFEDAKVEVNNYIYKQTLRDLEIPELEEGQSLDIDGLVDKMERAYYRNLKEAGLDKRETGKTHFGKTTGTSGEKGKLDEMFRRKHPNWYKKD